MAASKPYAPQTVTEPVCIGRYTEQEWIDYLLQSMPADRLSKMAAHLHTCHTCQAVCARWQALPDISGAPPLMPPDSVRQSLRARVIKHGRRRALRGALRVISRPALALAACLAVVLIGLGLFAQANQPSLTHQKLAEQYEPHAAQVLKHVETVVYRFQQNRGQGTLWLNRHSGEMLVVLEAPLPVEGFSMQAWAVRGQLRDSLGLLRFEDNHGHLYSQGRPLSEAENIAFTIEPDGGSDFPTAADIFWILLP